ncbi:MAG: hypothetical protein IJU91_06075 [Selenomonadaceae bacterium]|nr:hypothetical protein [Selenomonadaceae bacterium]
MSRAVEGCRITYDPGSSGSIRYEEVCESCGATNSTRSGGANQTINASFTCRNCGNRQRVRIERD